MLATIQNNAWQDTTAIVAIILFLLATIVYAQRPLRTDYGMVLVSAGLVALAVSVMFL